MTITIQLSQVFAILLALITAATAGVVGSYALMKRMTLAGDAFSHVALPGLGIAVLFNANPVVGGAAALLIGAFMVWRLERTSKLSSETAVGVIFSTSLAIGALLLTPEDLMDALFGNFTGLAPLEFALYLTIAVAVLWFLISYRNQLVLALFSSDLARAHGVKLDLLNLGYLLAFAGTIVLGLKFLGALLVGSLIIIPAATARQLTNQFVPFLVTSAGLSVSAVACGIIVSLIYGLDLGPITITASAMLFALTIATIQKKP